MQGHNRKISTQRIRNYVDWLKTYYLNPHFEIEREQIFPLLGMNAKVSRALANHRRINRLLRLLEEELSVFIRFEERMLYGKIRTVVNVDKLLEAERQLRNIQFNDEDWKDPFLEDTAHSDFAYTRTKKVEMMQPN